MKKKVLSLALLISALPMASIHTHELPEMPATVETPDQLQAKYHDVLDVLPMTPSVHADLIAQIEDQDFQALPVDQQKQEFQSMVTQALVAQALDVVTHQGEMETMSADADTQTESVLSEPMFNTMDSEQTMTTQVEPDDGASIVTTPEEQPMLETDMQPTPDVTPEIPTEPVLSTHDLCVIDESIQTPQACLAPEIGTDRPKRRGGMVAFTRGVKDAAHTVADGNVVAANAVADTAVTGYNTVAPALVMAGNKIADGTTMAANKVANGATNAVNKTRESFKHFGKRVKRAFTKRK